MNIENFETYLRQGNMAENTIAAYRYAVKEYYSRHKELNKRNLLVYKTYLIEKFKPKTVNLRIQAMNKYLDYMNKSRLRLKSVKVQQRSYLENVISNADYAFLKNKLKKEENQEWYFVVRFLAATGARVSELIQMKVEHVQIGYFDIYTKGGKIRRIYIPKSLRKEATEWLNSTNRTSGYLFLNRFGEAYHHQRYCAAVKKLCHKIWFERESGLSSFVSPSLCQEFLGEVQRYFFTC